ncbi:dockerin type I domain-containing protein, partial [uncultured Ruminococcus sp.]|uniref:dockerin type I domain-containing protein n=1 Tax=uncultured Ruminococcus sp. TaxID=165186 RepID=UPI00292F74D5
MKKLLSSVSVTLVLVMLLSVAAPMTASAAGDEITVKDLTAHIYNMEDTETMQCLFKSSMPDMAFISTVDFLKHIYVDEPSESKNADGTYTITNPKGTMVIDPQHDTLHFDCFEVFISAQSNVDGTEMDVPYLKEYAPVNEGEINGLDLDLSPYKIDIIEYDGKTYFPVSSIGLIVSETYNTAVYCNDEIYFVHSSDIAMGNCYFQNSAPYNTLKRSKDLVELTYNDLCFAVDKLYGRPAQAEIASMLEEKSFDETLDEYNDDTRRAKELLLSENMVDYILGTAYLGQIFSDGGHTAIHYPAVLSILTPGTAVYDELNRLFNEEGFRDANAVKYVMSNLFSSQRAADMSELRSGKYANYELVNAWDDKSASKLYVAGDTAVFAFDSFINEAVYHFKWSLDYAKEKGIKRFVIDLSCNSGGNVAVVMYIMAMITNKDQDSYVASYRKLQTLTGNIVRIDHDIDLNLDGEINDLDKSVYYDFEYAFITTNISYSCGNLLPCLAKDAGFPILGERSGGGACSLLIAYTPETFFYTLSSYNKFITKDNKDVDYGAELDFDLTKRVTDDAGNKTIDYSGLYDLEDISRKIDALYNGPVFGDVDGDGDVTIDDATLIQKAAIDLVSFTNLQKQLADVNGDGRVSVLDVTCVQKYIAEYTTGCGKTGEKMNQTVDAAHTLVKSVECYRWDYGYDGWQLAQTTSIEYENAYPVMIENLENYEDAVPVKTVFEYTFDGEKPATRTETDLTNNTITTVKYNDCRVYDYDMKHLNSSSTEKQMYQYGNGGEYFTMV